MADGKFSAAVISDACISLTGLCIDIESVSFPLHWNWWDTSTRRTIFTLYFGRQTETPHFPATDHITCGGSGSEKKQREHPVQLTERRSWFSWRKCCWTIKLSPLNRRRIKLTSIGFQLGLPPTQVLFWINSQKNNQPSSAGLSLQFSKGKALGTIC